MRLSDKMLGLSKYMGINADLQVFPTGLLRLSGRGGECIYTSW